MTHTPTAPASTPTPSPSGPLGSWLRDPQGTAHRLLTHLQHWLTGPGLALTAVLVALVVARACWWRHFQRRLATGARIVTIQAPPTVEPAGAAGLWANLVGLLRPAWTRRVWGQPHVCFEYAFNPDRGAPGTLAVRLWVPGLIPPGLVEHAIQAAWPGAHTTTCDAAPEDIRARRTVATGGQLRLARGQALPIGTDHPADPLRALLAAPAGLGEHEQAVVQVLARPVAGRRTARARRPIHPTSAPISARLAGPLLDLLTPHTPARPHGPAAGRPAAWPDSIRDRAITAKQRGPLFETWLRYAVTVPAAGISVEVNAARARACGLAHAIASAFAIYSGHNYYRRRRLHHPDHAAQARRPGGRGDLLSIPELAALAHLPTDADLPALQRAGARTLAPPPAIPTGGPGVKPLGHAARRRPVGLAVADARQHLHILGATGSGKSTLLAQLILADARAGRAAVVIDPKGDLVTDVLDRLPVSAAGRVVLIDAGARARPPCLNPLHHTPTGGGGVDMTVDNLTGIFARIYAAYWGPRTEDVFRAACLTLRAQPGTATLADLPRLLTEPAYQARALAGLRDPVLRGFWTWYRQLSDAGRAHAIAPLMNKLRAFLLRPFIRDALTGGPSTLAMPAILDHAGLCLVRIPKGILGEDSTKLVGSLVVAATWQAVTARAARPQHQRSDAGLYIDECHNFLNLPYPIADMLAEARGYRLSLTLAHQHLAQLGPDLRDAIATNARNKIYFATSPADARDLARHTSPHLSEHDLAHLAGYQAAARLVVHGEQVPPFTLHTDPLPPAIPGRARAIRHTARTAPSPPTPSVATRVADPRRRRPTAPGGTP